MPPCMCSKYLVVHQKSHLLPFRKTKHPMVPVACAHANVQQHINPQVNLAGQQHFSQQESEAVLTGSDATFW